MLVSPEGNEPALAHARFRGQVKSMDRVEKKQSSDPLVKILAAASEGVQISAFLDQRGKRKLCADRLQGLIANCWIGGDDEFGQRARHFPFCASNSTRPLKTSSRSWPASASAN